MVLYLTAGWTVERPDVRRPPARPAGRRPPRPSVRAGRGAAACRPLRAVPDRAVLDRAQPGEPVRPGRAAAQLGRLRLVPRPARWTRLSEPAGRYSAPRRRRSRDCSARFAVRVEGAQLGRPGLLAPAELDQDVAADGVVEVVAVQLGGEAVELAQRGGRAGDVVHGDGAVEPDDRRRRVRQQQVVQREDLRPVGVRPGRGLGVAGDDRGLQLVRARAGAARRRGRAAASASAIIARSQRPRSWSGSRTRSWPAVNRLPARARCSRIRASSPSVSACRG